VPASEFTGRIEQKRRYISNPQGNLNKARAVYSFSAGISQTPYLRVDHFGRKSMGLCRANIGTATTGHLDPDLTFAPQDFDVDDGYLDGGYGVVGDLERTAIRTVARTEGVLLDPVYTGRAFGGLLDLIKPGTLLKFASVVEDVGERRCSHKEMNNGAQRRSEVLTKTDDQFESCIGGD